jgi:predicted glycoside hydrolase/deacetylase ChbG (UPF0249 family)
MKTNRRKFIQTLGTGTVGLGLAATVPAAAAQSEQVIVKKEGRKLIVRGDDVGHSKVHNIGSFEAIEKGIVTSADVMMDSPGTEDALERLKALPWISVGWHTHMWGAPVLGARECPSLVEKGGQFDGRFRLDLNQAEDVVFDEAVRELRAQLDRCVRILGKGPDTGGGGRGNSPWSRAMKQVTEEFGLANGFTVAPNVPVPDLWVDRLNEKIKAAQEAGAEWAKFYLPGTGPMPAVAMPGSGVTAVENKWASRKITSPNTSGSYINLLTDSIAEVEEKYDPVLYYTEDRGSILKYPEDYILMSVWHPGYVDYYVYRLGERINRAKARQWVICRTQDVSALCDIRLKNWIKANRIELVNTRDALYGTSEYQNHLKVISSELAIEG